MSTDDLADAIRADLLKYWPDWRAQLTRKPSRSVVGTPLFLLRWFGGPDMGAVRDMLERCHFRVSVMFDHQDEPTSVCPGASARHQRRSPAV